MSFSVDPYRPWLEWVFRQTNTIAVPDGREKNKDRSEAKESLSTAFFYPSIGERVFKLGPGESANIGPSYSLGALFKKHKRILITEQHKAVDDDFLRLIANVLARDLLDKLKGKHWAWHEFIPEMDDGVILVPLLLDLDDIFQIFIETKGNTDLFSAILILMASKTDTIAYTDQQKKIFSDLFDSGNLLLLLKNGNPKNESWAGKMFSSKYHSCRMIVFGNLDTDKKWKSFDFAYYVVSPLNYSDILIPMVKKWVVQNKDHQWTVFSECFASRHRWRVLEPFLEEVVRANRKDLEWFCQKMIEGYEGFSQEKIALTVAILGRVLDLFPPFKIAPSQEIMKIYYSLLGKFFDNMEKNRRQGINIPTMDLIEAAEAVGREGDPRLDFWKKGSRGQDDAVIDKNKWQKNLLSLSGTRFRLGKYPVTVGEYRKFLNSPDYSNEDFWKGIGQGGVTNNIPASPEWWISQRHHPNRPIVNITWHEANAFCIWLGAKLEETGRLPTPVERKKAAGVLGYRYPWGAEVPKDHLANYDFNVGFPASVGLYADNCGPQGHRDLAGNVREWGARDDRFNAHVLGGGWRSPPEHLAVDFYESLSFRKREDDLGFRVLVEKKLDEERTNHLQPLAPYLFTKNDPIHSQVVFLFPDKNEQKKIFQFADLLKRKLITLFKIWNPFDKASSRHLAFHIQEMTPHDLLDPEKGRYNTHLWATADLGVAYVWADSWDIFRALAARDLVRPETLVLIRDDPSSQMLPKRPRGDYFQVTPTLMGESDSLNSDLLSRVPLDATQLDLFKDYVGQHILHLYQQTPVTDDTQDDDSTTISGYNVLEHPLVTAYMPDGFLDYWQTRRPCAILHVELMESGLRWDEGKLDESGWGNQHASEPIVVRTNQPFRQWLGLSTEQRPTVSQLWNSLTDILGVRSTSDDEAEESTYGQFVSAVKKCNEFMKQATFSRNVPLSVEVVEWFSPLHASSGFRFELLARYVNAFDGNRAMEIFFLINLEPAIRKNRMFLGGNMRLLILYEHTDEEGKNINIWLRSAIGKYDSNIVIVRGIESDLRAWKDAEKKAAWVECDAAIIIRPGEYTEKILADENHPLVARMLSDDNFPLLALYEITQNPWLPESFQKRKCVHYYETDEAEEILAPLVNRIQRGLKQVFRPKIFITHAVQASLQKNLSRFLWRLVERLERTGFEVLIEQKIKSAGINWLDKIREYVGISQSAVAILTKEGLESLFVRQELTWINENSRKEHFQLIPVFFADDLAEVDQNIRLSPLLKKWQMQFFNIAGLSDEKRVDDICREIIQPLKHLRNRPLPQTIFAEGIRSDEKIGKQG